MKSFKEYSKYPLASIGDCEIPRIILGTHPFDGTTYTSVERDLQFRKLWTGPESMVPLMKMIVQDFGVTASRGFPSSSQLGVWHQRALQLTMEEAGIEIAIVLGSILPLKPRPNIREYLYRLSVAKSVDFAKIWRHDPIIRYWGNRQALSNTELERFVQQTKQPLTPPREWKDVEVDYDMLDQLLDRFHEFTVPLYASNETWEFLILAERFDELQEIIKSIKRRFGTFVLGTHYAGIIIPRVESAGIAVDGYSTPVNAAGILMFPTQSLALHAVHATTKPVIAIKPLGGGRIPPQRAFSYIFREVGVTAAMVGIGNVAEAQETLHAARQVLRPERTH